MTAYIPSHAKIIKCTHQHDNSQKSVTNIPVDTPAIVVFGGELTTDPHTANSYSKMLHRVLDEEQISGMNIYSVAYEFASHSPHLERADLFRRAGPHCRHGWTKCNNKNRRQNMFLNCMIF